MIAQLAMSALPMLGQWADIYTTFHAIKHGAVEMNPIARSILKSETVFVIMKTLVGLCLSVAVYNFWETNRVQSIIVSVGGFLIGGGLAVWNLFQIRKMARSRA